MFTHTSIVLRDEEAELVPLLNMFISMKLNDNISSNTIMYGKNYMFSCKDVIGMIITDDALTAQEKIARIMEENKRDMDHGEEWRNGGTDEEENI